MIESARRAPAPHPDPAAAALRAFFRIAELWDLSTDEQIRLLGEPGRSTYFRWKREGTRQLSRDTLERISYLLGVYKALQILFPDPEAADAWVRRPNEAPFLGGASALERMLSGNVADLYDVRRHLDAQLGGWS